MSSSVPSATGAPSVTVHSSGIGTIWRLHTAAVEVYQIGNPDDLYIWNNISSGGSVYKYPTSNPLGIDYWLTLGRDYFTTAKPGYTPYTYPHPLRSTN